MAEAEIEIAHFEPSHKWSYRLITFSGFASVLAVLVKLAFPQSLTWSFLVFWLLIVVSPAMFSVFMDHFNGLPRICLYQSGMSFNGKLHSWDDIERVKYWRSRDHYGIVHCWEIQARSNKHNLYVQEKDPYIDVQVFNDVLIEKLGHRYRLGPP